MHKFDNASAGWLLQPMNLNRLPHFAAVVEAGSFTRAAERLGVSKAVVSHQVAELEREVGATLLVRSTRRVEPTEAGRLFHARCVSILRDVGDALAEVTSAVEQPAGTLRIAAPNDFGAAVLVPVVADFVARYPDCRVELELADQTVDLLSGRLDLAIRVGWLEDSNLQARKVGSFRQLLVASAPFAPRMSEIGDPSDLATLPFVSNMALKHPLDWRFSRAGEADQDVRMTAAISIDTTPAVLAAVLVGGGISVLPDFLVDDLLVSGRLVHALPTWSLPSGGIHAVFPVARYRPAKVRVFLDMLVTASRQMGHVLSAA